MIQIFLPMEDIPTATLQQKKAAYVNGRMMMYEPSNVKQAKSYYEKLLRPHRPKEPLKGPIAIHVRWSFPIKDKKKQDTWKQTRPDLDNMFKLIADRLTKIDFYEDDSQLVSVFCEKVYVKPGQGGVLIEITPITDRPYSM